MTRSRSDIWITFRRTMAYEWLRARSLRSSYGILLIAAMSGAIPYFNATHTLGSARPSDWGQLMTSGLAVTAIGCGVFGAMAAGHEYRYQSMSNLVSFIPCRQLVYFSKAMIVVLFSLTAYVVSITAAVTGLALGDIFSSHGAHAPSVGLLIEVVLASAGSLTGSGLMSLAVAFITQSLSWAIALPILTGSILEPVLLILLASHKIWLNFLPFSAARAALVGESSSGLITSFSPLESLGVFWAYVFIIAAFGWFRFGASSTA